MMIKALTTCIRDLTTSIAIRIGNNYYAIIGSSEGMSRGIYSSKYAYTTCKHILLTSAKVEEAAGALGYYQMSIGSWSSEQDSLKIYGPNGTRNMLSVFHNVFDDKYNSLQFFDLVPGMNSYQVQESKQNCLSIDSCLKCTPIYMKGEDENDRLSYLIQPVWTNGVEKNNKIFGERNYKQRINNNLGKLPTAISGQNTTSLYKDIKVNESINRSAIFFSIPSESYLPSLFQSPILKDFMTNSTNNTVGLIYHSVDCSVLLNESYLNFIDLFGKNVLHVLDNRDILTDSIPRKESIFMTNQYHNINSRVFPSLSFTSFHYSSTKILDKFKARGHKYEIAQIGKQYSINPKENQLQKYSQNYIIQKIQHANTTFQQYITNYKDTNFQELKRKLDMVLPTRKFTNEPNLILLGTSGKTAKAYRNTSSIFIGFPNSERNITDCPGMLLDCGEGTYGQLLDHFDSIPNANKLQ